MQWSLGRERRQEGVEVVVVLRSPPRGKEGKSWRPPSRVEREGR